MNIQLRSQISEPVKLSLGHYKVDVDEDKGEIVLSKDLATFRLQAMKRSSKMQVKKSTAQLRQVVGEQRWLLVVRTPPANEWVVSLS